MRTLLDNTLIHRIGAVLESAPGAIVNDSDLLAIFHLAEHILFAEGLTVSTFESSDTSERTAEIAARLSSVGVSQELLTLVPFSRETHAEACRTASWSILDHLVELGPDDLRRTGRLADESARPSGKAPWPFHLLKSDSGPIGEDDDWGGGAFRYTVENEALRSRLSKLQEESGLFDSFQIASLTALFRIKINQELARDRRSLYAPAPQRARLGFQLDGLLRYRLEKLIEGLAFQRFPNPLSSVVGRLHRLDSLPLPALAIHFLRGSSSRSPLELIEAAVHARSVTNVVHVRKWLSEWESKLASTDASDRLAALKALETWEKDLESLFSTDGTSVLASLRPGFSFEFDQVSGNPSFSTELVDWAEPIARLRRLLKRDCRFLAAVSSELATDTSVGSFLLRSINRSL